VGHTFTSVSGFYNYHFNENLDLVSLPVDLVATTQFPEHSHQFSQELRVASATGGSIEYLAGAYFQTDQVVSDQELTAPLFNFVAGFLPPLAPYLPLAYDTAFSQGERVYSVFGSLSWNVTDRLKLNTGLRAAGPRKTTPELFIMGRVRSSMAASSRCRRRSSRSERSSSWHRGRAVLQSIRPAWMPSAEFNIKSTRKRWLFSYARGFKAGGINGKQVFGSPLASTEFGPEHVKPTNWASRASGSTTGCC